MEQKEKSLLLQDLCARLPYSTLCYCKWTKDAPNGTSGCVQEVSTYLLEELMIIGDQNYECQICEIKPYLRPLSSMTEEEQFQLGRLLGATSYNLLKGKYSSLKELLEYVYKNHIDLFGLIPIGLALEAPDDMYK